MIEPDSPPPADMRDSVERVLADAFAEALGVTQIKSTDHFFRLGGHSLLVMRAAARIEARLGIHLPVSLIFEHPTVAALASHIPAASRTISATSIRPATAVENRAGSPLPALQRGMWFLNQGAGRQAAYLLPEAWRIAGPLDVPALRLALEALVRRHPALSTRYLVVDDVPRQVVAGVEAFALPLIDCRQSDPAARDARVSTLLAEEANHAFDLQHGTLLRAKLLQLDEDDHVLLLTAHHLAVDASSLHVVRHEIGELFRAVRAGVATDWESGRGAALGIERPSATPALSPERRAALLTYWRRQLAHLPRLELPVDRRRRDQWSDAGRELVTRVPSALCRRLEALAAECDVTLQMLLVAAYQILLGRYSGQTDFGVVSFASNRTAETIDAVGLFVNTIVIRADLSGAPSFREFVARVRQTSLGGYDHRELPFDELVADLRVDRRAGPNPLTGAAFQYLPMADRAPALDGVEVSRFPCPTNRTRFDVEMTVTNDGHGGLDVSLTYATDLWDPATMTRFVGCYRTLLESLVSTPEASIADLSCLSDEDRDEQLTAWSGIAGVPGRTGLVHERFRTMATRFPESVALESGGARVTYRELDARATRIARHLAAAGVATGDVVAILAEPANGLIEAMLGVLKAGAMYMPLAREDPPDRLAFVLQRATAAAVLTSFRVPPEISGVVSRVIDLADIPNSPEPIGPMNGAKTLTPDDGAYVMFTSGSTGRPKGVVVAHRGITRLVIDAPYVDFADRDAVACCSSPTFDALTFEVWGALLNGARLVVIDREILLSPRRLATAIRERRITVMFVTAALFRQLAAIDPATFAGLRCLIAGGDVVDPAMAVAVLDAGPPARLVNGYGPTENTTFSATYEITKDCPIDQSIPIGRPIAGSTCYVLGPRRELLPVGVVGELYVGGSGLARGYLNEDALTAERFVPHPFVKGQRLYATGDSVRWRSDGHIQFLGRRDRQVKLRGYRIELEEVEHALSLHPSISACAVRLERSELDDPRLVAYVALRHAPTSPPLEDYLRSRLPSYMIPAAIVELPSLPLTTHGKVDRARLPAVPRSPGTLAVRPVARTSPDLTATETIVAAVFCEVLRLEYVGPRDNFFDLGGDSLASMRLAGRLAATTGSAVSATDVFSHPTVVELAAKLDHAQAVALPTTLLKIRQGQRTPLYFPPGVMGDLIIEPAILEALPKDVPLCVFHAQPGAVPRPGSIEAMAARFCADLTTDQPTGPLCLAGYSFGGLLAYEMARQLRAAGRDIRLLAILDTGPDLSARGGPEDVFTRLALGIRNLPMWILEDLLRSFTRETPGRLWRSVKKTIRGIPLRATPGVVPKVEHLFDTSRWTPELYAHVDNNLKILGAFNFRPYDGDLVLFRARARPLFHAQGRDLGWQSLVRSVRVVNVPGNHHTFMREPNIQVLARAFGSEVERLS